MARGRRSAVPGLNRDGVGADRRQRTLGVTVRVLEMLDIYFVSVKYVLVSVKLMCVCVKFLKI
jgi:hypothetical protein